MATGRSRIKKGANVGELQVAVLQNLDQDPEGEANDRSERERGELPDCHNVAAQRQRDLKFLKLFL